MEKGHLVPTANLSNPMVMEEEAVVSPQEVYQRDITWVKNCDALVAEVSTPSHGVGYEIALAIGCGKPVFCCYHEGYRVSKMITGNTSPNLKVYSYRNWEELSGFLYSFLEFEEGNLIKSPEDDRNQ